MGNGQTETSTSRTVTLFGTIHQIQGAEKARPPQIDDPAYLTLVGRFMEDKDFVFEEASGLGPTKAERLALEKLGPGRYQDVDPPVDPKTGTRWPYGIGLTGESFPIQPCMVLSDFYRVEYIEPQDMRETLWTVKIVETDFTNALFICGELHTLSMAFRLRSVGIRIVEAWNYVPYLKLCRRPHVED